MATDSATETDPAVAANAQFVKHLFGSLTRASAAANQLPTSEEYAYHATTTDFKQASKRAGESVLQLVRAVASRYWQRDPLDMHSTQDVLENFEEANDVLDRILEQADVLIDRHQGLELSGGKIDVAPADEVQKTMRDRQLERDRAISRNDKLRPQLSFEDWPIDNSAVPFIPKIFFKPNAKIPLELTPLASAVPASLRSHVQSLGLDPEHPSGFLHPYAHEISTLEYNAECFQARKEQIYDTLDNTPITWIDSHAQLLELSEKLNTVTEIAIDLEAHSQRSFQGFCCLCQISTRTNDYLIDTLTCRSSMHLLNLPFTNPHITKVLHGADSDVLWLQRDFGLFIVNMFDTGQAARVLELPSFGLAHLLKQFCGVDADKKYQRADWRVRPLPQEMFRYAREDTHYLLYVYDRLRNQLLSQRSTGDHSLIRAVLERSATLCLKQYRKPVVTSTSHLELYNKHRVSLNPQQLRVFAALFAWRDRIARALDESTHFVQPNHSLFSLCERMPQSATQLVACCNPCPLIVRQHASEIVKIVLSAANGASSIPPSPALQPAQTNTALSPVLPPESQSAAAMSVKKLWQPTKIGSLACVSSHRGPVEGSMTWEPKPTSATTSSTKVQRVLAEIQQMSLLQVAAQSLGHHIAMPASPKLEPTALFEASVSEPVASTGQQVKDWLDEERQPAVQEQGEDAQPQSMVERYGVVGKGVSLKREKRKKGASCKKVASQNKRPKVEDEMTKGHPTN